MSVILSQWKVIMKKALCSGMASGLLLVYNVKMLSVLCDTFMFSSETYGLFLSILTLSHSPPAYHFGAI